MIRQSWVALGALAVLAVDAAAQHPADAPAFAASNLTSEGVRQMAAACAPCHCTQGRPVAGSTLAGLAGRSADDFVQAMHQFRDGKRPATVMQQIAKGFTDAEIAALGDYFAREAR